MAAILLMTLVLTLDHAPSPETDSVRPQVWGVELVVPDVEKSASAFSKALGFKIESRDATNGRCTLRSGRARIVLRPGKRSDSRDHESTITMNFRVADLDRSASRARDAGFTTEAEPQVIAIGKALTIRGPDGHRFHLIKMESPSAPATGLAVFNVSVRGKAITEVEPFFAGLGFEVFSRTWLPETLPFRRSGGVPVVLHPMADGARASQDVRLLFATSQPERLRKHLGAMKIEIAGDDSFPDPSGNRFQLEVMTSHALAFERLKLLKGDWEANSTKGWTGKSHFEVIANDSCVVERSTFPDDPEQDDGDRLPPERRPLDAHALLRRKKSAAPRGH